MIAREVIVLLFAMTVAGCSDPVRYSTPALDPGELALTTGDQSPSPPPHQLAIVP